MLLIFYGPNLLNSPMALPQTKVSGYKVQTSMFSIVGGSRATSCWKKAPETNHETTKLPLYLAWLGAMFHLQL